MLLTSARTQSVERFGSALPATVPGIVLVTPHAAAASRAEAGTMPPALRRFAYGLWLLTALSWAYNLACGFLLHMGYPYNSPLVAPASFFDDLLDWTPHMRLFHTAAFLHTPGMVSYPAPGLLVYWLFSLGGTHTLALFLLTAAAIVASALVVFAGKLRAAGLAWPAIVALLGTLLLTSYPLLFELSTGNIEIVLWGITMAAVWAYSDDRHNTATTLLGVAISLKFYPAVLLLLYLRRDTWWRILQSLAVAAAATLAALWCVCPDILDCWRHVTGNVGSFVHQDCLGYGATGYDHSIWAFYKTITSPFTYHHANSTLTAFLVVGGLGTLVLWFTRIQRMALWERLTFLTAAMLLLMPMSNDYRLLQLYVPLGMLVLGMARNRISRVLSVPALACFAVLLTAQAYIVVYHTHFSAQLKCLILLALVGLITLRGRWQQQPIAITSH